ncbi:MAG: ATP-dependent DNA ligase [Phycisphaerales bacterium]
MQRFARLYAELDATTSRDDKTAALVRYFREAPAADGAWALAILTGRRVRRAVSSTELRTAAQYVSAVPGWLIDECHGSVGDLGETLALILPDPASPDTPRPMLHELFERTILAMRRMSETQRGLMLRATWAALDSFERFVFHKLLSGTFRVGVSRLLAVRAMAEIAGVSQAEMDHRLMGDWEPTPGFFDALRRGEVAPDGHAQSIARPYPFYLAQQLDNTPWATNDLGPVSDWLAEWKWDGIRAQLIRRSGKCVLWSRGEEVISAQFPELVDAASAIPDGTVLDGEVLAWDLGGAERPLPFAALQTRINRKQEGLRLFNDVPVVFMTYDLLEHNGEDWRARPLNERRATLESLLRPAPPLLRASATVKADSWKELAAMREQARARGVEGLMLKRRSSVYGVGRTRGDLAIGAWWKWKIDPYSVDAVLIYAQRGSGRRASLYTDYTFGLWSGPERGQGELVPIAKAYSGLTDDEISQVDAFIREHTTGRVQGASMVVVEPSLVFELAFEGIAASTRHKSGMAVRFPRMARWRTDKKANEADTLDSLRRLLAASTGQEAAR